MPKKDNGGFARKAALRLHVVKSLRPAMILETHGGLGKLYQSCYEWLGAGGVVFETDARKSPVLARQRPTWRVYETAADVAIANGVVADVPFDLVDLDPYGDPWSTLIPFFERHRVWPETLGVVVNDGNCTGKVRLSGGWDQESIAPMARKWGRDLFEYYIDACAWYLQELAGPVGYTVTNWAGYKTGYNANMAHYAAILTRTGAA